MCLFLQEIRKIIYCIVTKGRQVKYAVSVEEKGAVWTALHCVTLHVP
jgi:hypothetical protein